MYLLDLCRGALSYRRLCALVTTCPLMPRCGVSTTGDSGHATVELLLTAIERRIAVLWAAVAAAFGQQIAEEHLAGPLDHDGTKPETEPEVRSLREIVVWMRSQKKSCTTDGRVPVAMNSCSPRRTMSMGTSESAGISFRLPQ